MAKDKAKIEYISERQLSPLELAFGVELGLNSHSKMVSEYKDKAKIEHISERQPSLLELTFGVKLGLNSHSKILRILVPRITKWGSYGSFLGTNEGFWYY